MKNLGGTGKKIGAAKLAGTARLGELLELAAHAHQARDMADAGLPTTYPPSQQDEDAARFTTQQAVAVAERTVRELSLGNDIIVAEFGGDLLSAGVPDILADPSRLNIVALIMVAESATAAIGMETKLHRISERYDTISTYVAGPATNLRANRNRVLREIKCAGCYDLWNQYNAAAPPGQRSDSVKDAQALTHKLLQDCGFGNFP